MRDIVYSKKEQTKFIAAAVLVVLGVMCFYGMFGFHYEKNIIPVENLDLGGMQQIAYTPQGCMQPVAFQGNGCFQPVAFQGNACMPGQFVAMQSGGLDLPIGVTLVGKGMVSALVPGSQADMAGIRVGDVINRINGK
ncbi:MAG: hypothetical protein HQL29_01410 [Candidatus Omnitrophica bacterium]|nr:hypothetical protein [Candidatus Omnitrophota bacterium]